MRTEAWCMYLRCVCVSHPKLASRLQEVWSRCEEGTEGNETACPNYNPTANHDIVDVDHPCEECTYVTPSTSGRSSSSRSGGESGGDTDGEADGQAPEQTTGQTA